MAEETNHLPYMTGERFSKLYLQFREELFLFARRLTNSEHRAKDLLQTAATKAYLKRNKLSDHEKFKSWASTILYNTYLSDYRKKKRRRELMDRNGMHTNAFFTRSKAYNDGFEQLKREDLIELCRNAGEDKYNAFAMYLEGYSYKEIGKSLEVPVGTVKSRIHGIRSMMRSSSPELALSN